MSRAIEHSNVQLFAIRPLTRRRRPTEVTDELSKLVDMTWAAVYRRITERTATQQLSKESLVCILRFYHHLDEREKADLVFMEIVRRVSGAIAIKIGRWTSMAGAELEDTRQSVLLGLHEYFYSLEPAEELWECNFKTCFDMRMINILGKLARGRVATLSINAELAGDGGNDEFEFPDPDSLLGFQNIEVAEALKHLDRVNPNLGRVFYLKYFSELPEREIATMLDVHERTIRNWLMSSRKVLQQYYAEQ